jgi:hypothetical protein
MLKNDVERLIKLVTFKENLTEEELAVKLKKNKAYISQQRTRGEFTKSFIDDLVMQYGHHLKTEPRAPVDTSALIVSMAARQQVQSRYIAELVAITKEMTVTKVLTEMEQLEKEGAERLIKQLGS